MDTALSIWTFEMVSDHMINVIIMIRILSISWSCQYTVLAILLLDVHSKLYFFHLLLLRYIWLQSTEKGKNTTCLVVLQFLCTYFGLRTEILNNYVDQPSELCWSDQHPQYQQYNKKENVSWIATYCWGCSSLLVS